MTQLTKEAWADIEIYTSDPVSAACVGCMKADLYELFARVEALEAELFIAKIYADKRSQELAEVYGQLARRDEENAALNKDNAKQTIDQRTGVHRCDVCKKAWIEPLPDWQSIATEALRLLRLEEREQDENELKALEDRFRAAGGLL
jgi:hypothetical protein